MEQRIEAIGYCSDQAPGALSNNTRVRKVNSEPGDAHANGTMGTIVGSMGPWSKPMPTPSGQKTVRYAYFIKWDHGFPYPVAVLDYKIEAHQ